MIRTTALDAPAYRRLWWRRLGRALGWSLLSGGWLWWRSLRLVLDVARRAPSYVEASHWLIPGFRLDRDEVPRVLALRLWRCLRLWRPDQAWCLSGRAIDPHTRSEALAGSVFLRDHGLPASARIVLEQQARDSSENLQRLPAGWQSTGPMGLVSNRWHLARCAWLAAELGVAVKICAAERRWRPGLADWLMAGREALALLSWAGPAVHRLRAHDLLRPIPFKSANAAASTTRKLLSP
ncbi:YdcF family protein [Pseudomarimonas arenosa]|uniref:YdcF family protein n=1 Tax=Pseudomarimonas arenosa TaxID=2774145 RepID=A0AAW3ZL53_9GAMM|nr:YdcF family protein [Pseudomarimonas arenosa]MBD8526863.1 YdcF family protein [Pseudomarimonas arenosa]